jgi:hypothetical protein
MLVQALVSPGQGRTATPSRPSSVENGFSRSRRCRSAVKHYVQFAVWRDDRWSNAKRVGPAPDAIVSLLMAQSSAILQPILVGAVTYLQRDTTTADWL